MLSWLAKGCKKIFMCTKHSFVPIAVTQIHHRQKSMHQKIYLTAPLPQMPSWVLLRKVTASIMRTLAMHRGVRMISSTTTLWLSKPPKELKSWTRIAGILGKISCQIRGKSREIVWKTCLLLRWLDILKRCVFQHLNHQFHPLILGNKLLQWGLIIWRKHNLKGRLHLGSIEVLKMIRKEPIVTYLTMFRNWNQCT